MSLSLSPPNSPPGRRSKRPRPPLLKSALPIALAMVLLVGGCQRGHGPLGVDRCADIAPGAVPAPVGTYACQWQNAHAMRAEMDDFVIYQYQWLDGGATPSPFGHDHLDQIARRLPEVPFLVIVERSDDPALDALRREAVVRLLAERGLPGIDERVIVGRPQAEAMYGDAAPAAAAGYFSGGRRGGTGTGGGGFGAGAGGGIGGLGRGRGF